MATIVLESQAETVRLAVFLACTHLWTCFHCQMPGARCSGGPRMGYRLRHWRSESGKTKQGCVYVCLSLQMSIETCSAWFAWNGLHLCMHDCSHLAYKALIGFEAFICSLPSWVHSLLWDLWDLTSAEVPSDSEVRGKRRRKRSVAYFLALYCRVDAFCSIAQERIGLYLICCYCIRRKGLRQSVPPVYCGLGSKLGFI